MPGVISRISGHSRAEEMAFSRKGDTLISRLHGG